MRQFCLHLIALSALAVGATPAFAGSPFYDMPDAAQTSDTTPHSVAYRQEGHFTCSYNERRTRLERKNCGGVRY